MQPENPLANNKTFYLIRHGQTDWNAARRIQGHQDVTLNIRGQKEAQQLRDFIYDSSISCEHIFSSDLIRAQLTAKICFPNHQIQLSQALRECCLGDVEGLTPIQVKAKHGGKIWHDWSMAHDTDIKFPNGESKNQLLFRVKNELERIAHNNLNAHSFLIFTHGGCIRQMLKISSMETAIQKLPIANGSVFELNFSITEKTWNFTQIVFVPK